MTDSLLSQWLMCVSLLSVLNDPDLLADEWHSALLDEWLDR